VEIAGHQRELADQAGEDGRVEAVEVVLVGVHASS